MSSNGHSGGFAMTSERTGTTVRIVVSGELDLATAPLLREQTDRQLADHAEFVVLDLADVAFIDSSGLRELLLAVAYQDGARVRIVPSPHCLRVFEMAGVRDLLPLIDTETQVGWRGPSAGADAPRVEGQTTGGMGR